MLRGLRLTQESKIVNGNFTTSMMSAIHPKNKPLVPVPVRSMVKGREELEKLSKEELVDIYLKLLFKK
jgi:hypothetical protein